MQAGGRAFEPLPQVSWEKPLEQQPAAQPLRPINPNVSAQQLPKDPWGANPEPQDTRGAVLQGPTGHTVGGLSGTHQGAAGPQQAWEGRGQNAQQVHQAQRGPQHAQRGPNPGQPLWQGPVRQPYMPHLVGQQQQPKGSVAQQAQRGPSQRQQQGPQPEGRSQGQGVVQPAPGLQAPGEAQQVQGHPQQAGPANVNPAKTERLPNPRQGQQLEGQGERQQGQGQRAGRRSPPQSQRTQGPPSPPHQSQAGLGKAESQPEDLPGPPRLPQPQRSGQGARRVLPINPTTASGPKQGSFNPPAITQPPPPPPPRASTQGGSTQMPTQGGSDPLEREILPGPPPRLPEPGSGQNADVCQPASAEGQASSEQGASGSAQQERLHDPHRSRESRGGRGKGGRSTRERCGPGLGLWNHVCISGSVSQPCLMLQACIHADTTHITLLLCVC